MAEWNWQTVRIDYTNWRGERRERLIIPTGFAHFGSNEWHPDTQWMLEAVDVDDMKTKDFAMKDIHSWSPVKEPRS